MPNENAYSRVFGHGNKTKKSYLKPFSSKNKHGQNKNQLPKMNKKNNSTFKLSLLNPFSFKKKQNKQQTQQTQNKNQLTKMNKTDMETYINNITINDENILLNGVIINTFDELNKTISIVNYLLKSYNATNTLTPEELKMLNKLKILNTEIEKKLVIKREIYRHAINEGMTSEEALNNANGIVIPEDNIEFVNEDEEYDLQHDAQHKRGGNKKSKKNKKYKSKRYKKRLTHS